MTKKNSGHQNEKEQSGIDEEHQEEYEALEELRLLDEQDMMANAFSEDELNEMLINAAMKADFDKIDDLIQFGADAQRCCEHLQALINPPSVSGGVPQQSALKKGVDATWPLMDNKDWFFYSDSPLSYGQSRTFKGKRVRFNPQRDEIREFVARDFDHVFKDKKKRPQQFLKGAWDRLYHPSIDKRIDYIFALCKSGQTPKVDTVLRKIKKLGKTLEAGCTAADELCFTNVDYRDINVKTRRASIRKIKLPSFYASYVVERMIQLYIKLRAMKKQIVESEAVLKVVEHTALYQELDDEYLLGWIKDFHGDLMKRYPEFLKKESLSVEDVLPAEPGEKVQSGGGGELKSGSSSGSSSFFKEQSPELENDENDENSNPNRLDPK